MSALSAAPWTLAGNLAVHDPSLCREGGTWWVFSTGSGLPIKRSSDGLVWTQTAPRFSAELPWWRNYVPGMGPLDVWAPDVHSYGGRVWCFYCVSQFGTNVSAIGLTSCSSLQAGDWRDDGPVLTSSPGPQAYNALDPSLVFDAGGAPWLVFGSWFDGIHLSALDPATLKPTGQLKLLAARSGGIEAANIVHSGGWYYLFVSIDRCCLGVNSTYKIAVGRATAVDGPYLDRDGVALAAGGGTVLLQGDARWKGPGGQSVVASGGGLIAVYHAYDALNNGQPTLQIADVTVGADGWPALGSPPPETGGRLINLSCRVPVPPGQSVAMGMVVGGNSARSLLIRASGPALQAFGVTPTLPDPTLNVYHVVSGQPFLLAADAGWRADPAVSAAADSVGAFSWGASATADSALVVTVPPGAYTAEVSGLSGDSGTALLEAYEMP